MDLKMEDFNAPHSMGTTIIGVTYNGGVVLGADYFDHADCRAGSMA